MKRRIILGATLAGLMIVPAGGLNYAGAPAAQPATPAPAAPAPQAKGAPHPEMTAALRALVTAKEHLERGAKEFGGHRVKALELTNQAIREVEEGLSYAKSKGK